MSNINREVILTTIRQEMPVLHDRFGVEQIALFGSYANGQPTETSDVDLVVSLKEPLGFAFIQLAEYLEAKLDRKVDLITASTLEFGRRDPRRSHIANNIQESLIYV